MFRLDLFPRAKHKRRYLYLGKFISGIGGVDLQPTMGDISSRARKAQSGNAVNVSRKRFATIQRTLGFGGFDSVPADSSVFTTQAINGGNPFLATDLAEVGRIQRRHYDHWILWRVPQRARFYLFPVLNSPFC